MWRNVTARRMLVALAALGLVCLVAGIGVWIFLGALAATFDGRRQVLPDAFPSGSDRPPAATGQAAKAVNILLLGTDTRGTAPTDLAAIRAQRSDTMLLVHISGDRKHVYVMSIMRDSWVDIPGHGAAKINAALSYGGVPLTVQTVERLLGVRIDHVAVVSFSGFEGLTDALGGVTLDNPIAFSNIGYSFWKGRLRLNGNQALAYVRARYPFADGDYQRVRNQQRFLKAVLDTVLRQDTLLDPGKVTATVAAIAPYLLVDRGLDAAYLGALGLDLRSMKGRDVEFFTAPTTGTGTEGDQSVVRLDRSRIAQIGRRLKADSMGGFRPCDSDVC